MFFYSILSFCTLAPGPTNTGAARGPKKLGKRAPKNANPQLFTDMSQQNQAPPAQGKCL